MPRCPAIAALSVAITLRAGAPIQFEEIADKAGLRFHLANGAVGRFHQIELMPGGVAAFDFDQDGRSLLRQRRLHSRTAQNRAGLLQPSVPQ